MLNSNNDNVATSYGPRGMLIILCGDTPLTSIAVGYCWQRTALRGGFSFRTLRATHVATGLPLEGGDVHPLTSNFFSPVANELELCGESYFGHLVRHIVKWRNARVVCCPVHSGCGALRQIQKMYETRQVYKQYH